MAVGQS